MKRVVHAVHALYPIKQVNALLSFHGSNPIYTEEVKRVMILKKSLRRWFMLTYKLVAKRASLNEPNFPDGT